MRKIFRKALMLCAVLACTLGVGAFASCGEETATVPTDYDITCTVEGGAQVSVPENAEAGETVKLDVQLENGYYLRKITVNGQELTSATFIMPACDVEIIVYAANGDTAYAISAEKSAYGEILPAASEAKAGDTVTATVRARDGYRLRKVYANGVQLLFDETEDFTYTVKTIMQDNELVFTAEYAENPELTDEYAYELTAAYSQAKEKTATSYWSMQYLDEGVFFRVLVKDDNVIQNGRLQTEERDFVEFRICESTNAPIKDANALRCLVTADGTFLLQRCLGGDDYAESGYGVHYVYGENFTTETYLCSTSKNRFDGYAVEVFLGYELFGLTKSEAVGNMTFAPALNNTIGTDGAKKTYGTVYASAETAATRENCETYFADEYKCLTAVPATWLGVTEKGEVFGRYSASAKNTEYLFLGDGTFLSSRWTGFAESLSEKVRNVAFEGALVSDYASEAALNFAQTVAPANVLFGIGAGDVEAGASAPTAATRIIGLLQTYHAALPQTKLYWSGLLPDTKGVAEVDSYAAVNEAVKAFAASTDYITVIDCSAEFLRGNGLRSFYIENGELTAEGYDAYVANTCAALGLKVIPDGTATFGNAEYGYTSGGWEVSGDGAIGLTERKGDDKKYAYFAELSSTDFRASATFAAEDVFNGDETPEFGMVLANATERLYFYVRETYSDGELMKKVIGYTLFVDGEEVESGTKAISMYYRDGETLTLSVDKTANGVDLYVSGYKAFTLTGTSISDGAQKASAGVYSENMQITVTKGTVTDREV